MVLECTTDSTYLVTWIFQVYIHKLKDLYDKIM